MFKSDVKKLYHTFIIVLLVLDVNCEYSQMLAYIAQRAARQILEGAVAL